MARRVYIPGRELERPNRRRPEMPVAPFAGAAPKSKEEMDPNAVQGKVLSKKIDGGRLIVKIEAKTCSGQSASTFEAVFTEKTEPADRVESLRLATMKKMPVIDEITDDGNKHIEAIERSISINGGLYVKGEQSVDNPGVIMVKEYKKLLRGF